MKNILAQKKNMSEETRQTAVQEEQTQMQLICKCNVSDQMREDVPRGLEVDSIPEQFLDEHLSKDQFDLSLSQCVRSEQDPWERVSPFVRHGQQHEGAGGVRGRL